MNNIPTVYFISALGADKNIFQFLDLSFCNPVFVGWIPPLADEQVGDYSKRLKDQIADRYPVIVGVSFGGIIGVEIARQFPVKKLVLLSSVKTAKEIPFYMRMLKYIPIHKITSISFLRKANHTIYRYMGIEKRSDKIIFEQMLYNTDEKFMKWAINQTINWNNNHVLSNAVHIHGTADILFPHKYIKSDFVVRGGDHLMVMTKGALISKLLRQIILG